MRHLFFLLLICSFSSCGHPNETIEIEKPFKIDGKIDDENINNLVVRYYKCESESWIEDTIPVINGTFTVEGLISPFAVASFSIDDMSVSFFLDPGEMQLYLKRDSLENSVLKGSKNQSDKEKLEVQTKSLEDYLYRVNEQIKSEQNEQNKDFLIKQRDSIGNLLDNIWIDFITSNPTSHYSLNRIFLLLYNRNQNIDVIMDLFNGLSEDVRVSCTGREVYGYILQREKSSITNVSSFEAFDKDGTLVKLSDFEGKYVLIDFWATWCTPCIAGFPHLKELYAKYKEKGLVVLSISIDEAKDEQKWLDALEKYDITEWIHILSCRNKGENNICDLYEMRTPVPHYVVIDNSGNVIKRWIGFNDEVAKEQDEMFEHIFESKE